MGKILDIIDLTLSDEDDDEVAERPKKARIEIPYISPSLSDAAPVLELAVPPTDNDPMTGVSESYLTSVAPPILEPEVELPIPVPIIVNVQGSNSSIPQPRNKSSDNATATSGSMQIDDDPEPGPSYTTILFKEPKRIGLSSLEKDKHVELRKMKTIVDKTISELKNKANLPPDKNKRKDIRSDATINNRINNCQRARRKPRNKYTRRNPEQIAVLQRRFALDPSPKASQIHEISAETGLSTVEIKRWFRRNRSLNGIENVKSQSPGFPVGTIGGEESQPQTVERDVETDPSLQNHSRITRNAVARLRYIQSPHLRIQDMETIKRDVKNMGKCRLDTLKQILESRWEVKAERILSLYLRQSYGLKKTILKEARRIKDIASYMNPFSEGQESEISSWKKGFINKMELKIKNTTASMVKDAVEEIISPFIAPYVYSKSTLQDGRFLTLEVALYDFCKISNRDPDWKWETPALIQYPLS